MKTFFRVALTIFLLSSILFPTTMAVTQVRAETNGAIIITVDGMDIEKTLWETLTWVGWDSKWKDTLREGQYLVDATNNMSSVMSLIQDDDIIPFPWSGDASETLSRVIELHAFIIKYEKIARDSNKKFIIVSHSWGTVLAYAALQHQSEDTKQLYCDLFITLGSPLGTYYARDYKSQGPSERIIGEYVDFYLKELHSFGLCNDYPRVKKHINYWTWGDIISGPVKKRIPFSEDFRVGYYTPENAPHERGIFNAEHWHKYDSLQSDGIIPNKDLKDLVESQITTTINNKDNHFSFLEHTSPVSFFGNSSTEFNFAAKYRNVFNHSPGDAGVNLVINGVQDNDEPYNYVYPLSPADTTTQYWEGKKYDTCVSLPAGNYQAHFETIDPDSNELISTDTISIYVARDGPFNVGEDAPDSIVFVNTYLSNGGPVTIGTPINAVHRWYNCYIQDFRDANDVASAIMLPDGQSTAYAVIGDTWTKYLAMGGPTGALGYPLSNPTPFGPPVPLGDPIPPIKSSSSGADPSYTAFEGGKLVTHGGSAYFLGHGIFEKWQNLDYGLFGLGLPISDEKDTPASGASGFDTIGVMCEFEGGCIYWHGQGAHYDQAYEIHGDISSFFEGDEIGGTGSWLGFPISDVYEVSTNTFRADFEGGYITGESPGNFHAYAYSSGAVPVILTPGTDSAPGPIVDTLKPTLVWENIPEADYYALAISEYPYGPSHIIFNPQNLTGTELVVPSSILEAGQKYRWNMQAHVNGQWSAISNTLYFQTTDSAVLTLRLHRGSVSGELLSDVQLTGEDGGGNSFSVVTDAEGTAVIPGTPGLWQFEAFLVGYQTAIWLDNINTTITKDAFLTISLVPTVSWEKTFGGTNDDIIYTIQETSDGGFIMTGVTNTYDQVTGSGEVLSSYGDLWLVKTDSLGNKIWEKTFSSGSNLDVGYDVEQTIDGGYIVTGWYCSQGIISGVDITNTGDVWLIKIDANGNREWDKTFGGSSVDIGRSVHQTEDGGYIVAGGTRSFGAGWFDAWLVKTDALGNEQWNRTYGGGDGDQAYSIQQAKDGGYVFAGYTYNFGAGGADFWLVKTDDSGAKQWDKTFGGSSEDGACSLQETSDDGYIIVGSTSSFGTGLADVWLIKTDAYGDKQWDKTFGGVGDDVGRSVRRTSEGGYIVAGYTNSSSGKDAFLVKTNYAGNELWEKIIGGAGTDAAYAVVKTGDGGYAIGGFSASSDIQGEDGWLAKIDAVADNVISLSKISPDNNPFPAFNWNTIPGAISYEICVDNNPSWKNIGNTVTYIQTTILSKGNHNFSVRALDNSGNSISRSDLAFVVSVDSDLANTKIAMSSSGKIILLNADLTDPTFLTFSGLDYSPSWSPDGSKIAFQSGVDGNSVIIIIDVDDLSQRILVDSGDNLYPSWSPDGSEIAFSSNRDGNYGIYTINENGSEQSPRLIYDTDEMDCLGPRWSPDGSQIVFWSQKDSSDTNRDVWVINTDGSGLNNLTSDSPMNDENPSWSPDGEKIVFLSDREHSSGKWNGIYLMSPDGSNPKPITPIGPECYQLPEWSPDGSKITFMYSENVASAWTIATMNVDSSGLNVFAGARPNSFPSWSPFLVSVVKWPLQPLSGNPGSITVLTDETQLLVYQKAASSVTFPTGTWILKLKTDSDWKSSCVVAVGAYNADTDQFIPFDTILTDPYENGYITITLDQNSSGTIDPGDYLAFQITNNDGVPHEIILDGSSYVIPPEGSPDYPLPEMATGILLGIGIAGLAAYVLIKRRKATSSHGTK
jgi:Tol biopolymer transport system component